ncbi:MAG TPA: efflux transporter outer membrane subunit [Alphaproteobacteria bacterium]|jgi:NodT family efflux transporter outer membrane factor (OMF) lipoprotein|nr:efflux transporter outer membrane subunit [Alphaproteobacteria bacterium]
MRSAVLAGLLLLTGCNFAPDYHPPDTDQPAAYKETAGTGRSGAGSWQPAKPADEIPRGKWWAMFGDDQLNGLEDKVTAANQDIKAAVARFDQARAASEIARAQFYPTVGSSANYTRQRQSETVANPRPISTYNDMLFNLDISYEVDLWGRVRNSVNSAEYKEQASAGDLAALDLSTHAELASDYFTLRGDDAQQTILDQTVTAYRKAYELTVRRHDGGAAAESDVDQAQDQLETARTQAEDVRLRRAQLEHAIAILIGVPPAEFSLAPKPLLEAAPPVVDPGLPASLLERRPDVAAAERRAASANADIGVARAAFFPTLTLSAMGGFESAMPSSWITAPSRIWSLGPALNLPIFDGGQRNGVTDQAIAAFNEAAANYRQTVLDAYRDVEDNLAALRQLAAEAQSEAGAVTASGKALHQAELRYTGGLTTYLEVAQQQNNALQAQLSAADIAARRMAASIALVKAMGGGWKETPDLEDPRKN